MGWWGTDPWDGDDYGNAMDAIASDIRKRLKKEWDDTRGWRGGPPSMSRRYALAGMMVRFADADIPLDEDLWEEALDTVRMIAAAATSTKKSEFGGRSRLVAGDSPEDAAAEFASSWRDVKKFRDSAWALKKRMEKIEETRLGRGRRR